MKRKQTSVIISSKNKEMYIIFSLPFFLDKSTLKETTINRNKLYRYAIKVDKVDYCYYIEK